MHKFNNLQQLWDYCVYCPICNKNCRKPEISAAEDSCFKLANSDKYDSKLTLNCTFVYRDDAGKRITYPVKCDIDCLTNEIDVNIQSQSISKLLNNIEKYYFYIESFCDICKCAATYTEDIELDILNGTISNFVLEEEKYYLLQCEDKYRVRFIYYKNYTSIRKCYLDYDNIAGIKTNSLSYKFKEPKIILPLINLDISNQKESVDKIKTLILLS